MNTAMRESPEIRERAVRLVAEHQAEYESPWAARVAMAAKIGCTAKTRRSGGRQAERAQSRSHELSTVEHDRFEALERENRGLRCANDLLRQAAVFAQTELDCHGK